MRRIFAAGHCTLASGRCALSIASVLLDSGRCKYSSSFGSSSSGRCTLPCGRQASSDFQYNFLQSGPLQEQRSLHMLQRTAGRHDRSRFPTSTFSYLFRLKYAQISQNTSKYQNRENIQNMDMNCDFDIKSRPNKRLKIVQNLSVSSIPQR